MTPELRRNLSPTTRWRIHGLHRTSAVALCAVLVACGASGGGLESAGHRPPAPSEVTAVAGEGAVLLDWTPSVGADSYIVRFATVPGAAAAGEPLAVTAPPFRHEGRPASPHYYVVSARNAAGESQPSQEVSATPRAPSYTPAWASLAPTRTLTHRYDGARSDADNGLLLKAAIERLQAGDRLEIEAGRYSIAPRFSIDLSGTAQAPIRIAAATGANVVLTRPDANQNVVNLGSGSPCRYLSLEGLEVTGGSQALKLYACTEVWIDRCHIHHCGDAAIAANSADTQALWLTRNDIHDTTGTGEGMYLGANNGQYVTHHSVVAQNKVYRCGGNQGDGIEVKQGSYANLIAENEVFDCNYPCILVYGTAGREPNVIERNVCYRSNDNVLQVQGEAIVRNNLLIGGAAAGFASHDHQGQSRDLVFVHNTILTASRAANLVAWNGRPGMVFANNVLYSSRGDALRFGNGSAGVTISGNVVLGSVSGTSATFLRGVGLSDFEAASYDGSARDARPKLGTILIGAADPAWAVSNDLLGATRSAPIEVGCFERN